MCSRGGVGLGAGAVLLTTAVAAAILHRNHQQRIGRPAQPLVATAVATSAPTPPRSRPRPPPAAQRALSLFRIAPVAAPQPGECVLKPNASLRLDADTRTEAGPPCAGCERCHNLLGWAQQVLRAQLLNWSTPAAVVEKATETPPLSVTPSGMRSSVKPLAVGTVHIEGVCIDFPAKDVPVNIAVVSAAEETSAFLTRLTAEAQNIMRVIFFDYDTDGNVLPKSSPRRPALALFTPEDIFTRIYEMPVTNDTAVAGSPFVRGNTHLLAFSCGRGARLLWNFNHMLNRLLPSLWVASEMRSENILVPNCRSADEGDWVGAMPLFLQILASYSAATGTRMVQIVGPASTDTTAPAESCGTMCFESVNVGQPRFAPSEPVRLAILKTLFRHRPVPEPRTASGQRCAALTQAHRVAAALEEVPFFAEPKRAMDCGWKEGATEPSARKVKAVVIERRRRRAFGEDGLAVIRKVAEGAGWDLQVSLPPEHATEAPLSVQAEPFLDADVLISASGAGLSWAFVMAPGGAVIELSGPKACSVMTAGLNQPSSYKGDATAFGGLVRSAGLNHIGIAQRYMAELPISYVDAPFVRVHPHSMAEAAKLVTAALQRPLESYLTVVSMPEEVGLPNETFYHRCTPPKNAKRRAVRRPRGGGARKRR